MLANQGFSQLDKELNVTQIHKLLVASFKTFALGMALTLSSSAFSYYFLKWHGFYPLM